MTNNLWIGIDTGGTFTDFVIYSKGKISIKKIPSTPQNPSLAILEGIREFISKDSSFMLIHGTTIATNALLERKGGRIALITTKGFEDILFIGRQTRKNLYCLHPEERISLLQPQQCIGINERTLANGKVEKKISPKELTSILEKLSKMKLDAVAVSLIHSYINPYNEKVIKEQLEKNNLMASISHEIFPEHREYERTTVTAVNAYIMPVICRYLENLEDNLNGIKLRIMQSNEGYVSPDAIRKEPIRTALSGPAGGVVGAYHLGKSSGFRNIITFDMGGTSSDVSLIDGKISRTQENVIGDFPIRLPMIDIHTVGAGGGSIAYIDSGGSLRVGPQSAGADPGPACYGRGKLPTVTDANLVLGRLDPNFFLGGSMTLFPERSLAVIQPLAKKIKKSIVETAEGIIEIANANMEKAIRVISIERGFDMRDFSLFSFGGAGGMHAAEIASDLKITKVIVPKNAGVLSALGLLLADSIKDFTKSILKPAEKLSLKKLDNLFETLGEKSLYEMEKEGFNKDEIKIYPYVDLRYLGQSYEITIPYKKNMSYLSDFHEAHQKLYSYHNPQRPIEIVNIKVKAVGMSHKIRFKKFLLEGEKPNKAFVKNQNLYFKGEKYQAPIFKRSLLSHGNKIHGPALVVDEESTTFLPPSYILKVDAYLNLIIQKRKHVK